MFREVLCQAHCLHRLAAAMLRQWAVGWCAIHSNAIQVPRCLVMTEVDRNCWSHRADLCLPAAAVCRQHHGGDRVCRGADGAYHHAADWRGRLVAATRQARGLDGTDAVIFTDPKFRRVVLSLPGKLTACPATPKSAFAQQHLLASTEAVSAALCPCLHPSLYGRLCLTAHFCRP